MNTPSSSVGTIANEWATAISTGTKLVLTTHTCISSIFPFPVVVFSNIPIL
jgi:hypothetical protein